MKLHTGNKDQILDLHTLKEYFSKAFRILHHENQKTEDIDGKEGDTLMS